MLGKLPVGWGSSGAQSSRERKRRPPERTGSSAADRRLALDLAADSRESADGQAAWNLAIYFCEFAFIGKLGCERKMREVQFGCVLVEGPDTVLFYPRGTVAC